MKEREKIRKIESIIRIVLFVVLITIGLFFVLGANDLKTSIKCIGASISFFVAVSSLFIPSDTIKIIMNIDDKKVSNANPVLANAGNQSVVFVIQGDVNGNVAPQYDAKKELRDRRMLSRQMQTSRNPDFNTPLTDGQNENLYEGSVDELADIMEISSNRD